MQTIQFTVFHFVILFCFVWFSFARENTRENCRFPHCKDTPLDRDVIYDEATYNGANYNFGDGATTLCLPDNYGYIGETSGMPNVITYAFGLETDTYVEVLDVLKAIKISIEDFIISFFFAEDCIHGRKLNGSFDGIVGFHFETEIDLMSGK